MKTDLKKLKKRFEELKTVRQGWDSLWQELTENFLPRRGKYLNGQEDNEQDRGKQKNDKIKKSVAYKAIGTLASGMQGGLTSPSRQWFRLLLSNSELMQVQSVKEYLHYIEQAMYHVFAKSNIYGALYSCYEELCVYGVSAIVIEEDLETVIHPKQLTIGEYWIGTDSRNRPDTLYRKFQMTASQIIEEFGEENCSNSVLNAFNSDKTEQKFNVIHAIQPKDFYDKDDKERNYISVYWEEKNSDDKKVLRESGYTSRPFMCPRWNAIADDCYGESPAMHALGDLKEIQKITDLKLEGIEKEVRPPFLADSSLKGNVNTAPNAITYVNTQQAMAGLQPLYKYQGNLANLRMEINELTNDIRQIFYNDLFLSVTEQDKRMTATEVTQRREEKMLLLGQVIERIESELLDALIDRTFEIMKNLDLLPPAPPEIAGMDIKIEYVSLLAQAQKMTGLGSIQQLTAFVSQIAPINPDILDKLDFDESIDQYAEILGVAPQVVRSDEAVAKIRAVRQQQIQQQQQMAQMQQLGEQAKTLSDTKVGDKNGIEALLAGLGGMNG